MGGVAWLKPVEVSSGEENDLIVWSERSAKLFRFDKENGWKERGRGPVKLLKSKDTHKTRFLMRSEGTMKVIANHLVPCSKAEMKQGKTETTRIWTGFGDRSDEESRDDLFCIRFAEVGAAEKFQKEFELAQKENSSEANGSVVPTLPVLAANSSPPPTVLPTTPSPAHVCTSDAQQLKPNNPFSSLTFGAAQPLPASGWAVEFGGKFTAAPPQLSRDTELPLTDPLRASQVSAMAQSVPQKTAFDDLVPGNGEDGPTIEGEALFAEVAVRTGEEDEELLWDCELVKLYRFVDSQWKERGKGSLKFLKHKNTGKIRLLMRQAVTLKICANHLIPADQTIKVTVKGDAPKNATWQGLGDVADDEKGEDYLYTVRFQTESILREFREKFVEAQCENAKSAGGSDAPKSGLPLQPPAFPVGSTVSLSNPFRASQPAATGFTFTDKPKSVFNF
eukprot:NODE_174_length_1465_cov_547.638418_g107_i0.p1 GENE.NODE_174_length_1465_cov_547.638418_g107_i0~~NODE_174_length_1465_cov_547.638418_g107_i0.p1  ORF type:complete len:456 (-),score=114.10 NODE_174_length_1465_cov_547.638418_g107_i0:97-1443(-)